MAKNTFCHIEWFVTDLAKARKFYEGLFEWKFQEFGSEMIVFGTGDQHLGGLSKKDAVQPGDSPSVWLEVDDLLAYCAKAPGLGGSVIREKTDLPGVGYTAQLADPDGNHVGLVEFAK